GKLHTTLEQLTHGHHAFRAYWKHGFAKQYEKFSTFLRNEICSNNLTDFGLRKGLDHLAAVREKFLEITERLAAFQAQCLSVHSDFPRLQRLALPIPLGTTKYPGIKIHNTPMIRLMEVLLHAGTLLGGWRASQLHEALPLRPVHPTLRNQPAALRPPQGPRPPRRGNFQGDIATARETRIHDAVLDDDGLVINVPRPSSVC
ncbi:MAG: hypothetical protein ACREXS_06100, partial [Gammaproteobacteria bacterium]